ncbi:hypothetical protein BDW71DRAFT_217264 [Aspergillus fruticulosus]
MPSATEFEIFNEPDWTKTHSHRVGLRSRDDRFPGLTHPGDDWRFVLEEEAEEKIAELRGKVERGELLTVRDILAKQQDFHLKRPDVHPKNWRYVLHTSENHIKEEQPWLINEKKKEKQKEEEEEENKDHAKERRDSKIDSQDAQGKQAGQDQDSKEEEKEEPSPEEKALLKLLRDEEAYMHSLKQNTGKGHSPAKSDFLPAEIDEIDQMTPDNWIPRTDHLIRITGKHPLNAEPALTELFDAGLITPNWLHYVRSHGSVPHLLWENHKLEISAGENLTLFMDDLKDQFESINIPVLVACDGNRRKELNMVKRSKGFNWGPGAVGCAYWRGVRLRDVLKRAGIKSIMDEYSESHLWVNFQGAETLSEGKYQTCLPLEYVMGKRHDVLLAYEMNDSPLPPDHGYPLRLVVPGYVGGRWVKWLEKIWVTERENDSHYHIWDNRVVPEFVTDRESELAKTLYRNPSTACMEQALNSIIVRPGPGEKIDLEHGFAYNGGGNEIQKVEISLDEGASWVYCARRVRCWDVNKNTQPENPTWNLEGMMNNCHYIVKSEIAEDEESGKAFITFRHPCEPATGEGGWMEPSAEIRAEESQRQASTPGKQFTREEIEKHSTEDDCWIVVNGNVYDATSVMSWHPGGKAPIMAHAGRVHQDTTNEFESVHDNFAHSKLQECILGTVTKKAQDFMKQEAKVQAEERARSSKQESRVALRRHRWTQARFVRKTPLSEDTNRYTFELLSENKKLGLQTGQHIQLGFHFTDQLVFRSYTPVKPILEEEEDGTFDLVVKTYYPDPGQPGGTMSNILDCLAEGEEVEIKGPAGEIVYKGNGTFKIDDRERTFERITLVLGGSGVTPGYQVIAKILLSGGEDKTKIRVIDGNRGENDILLRKEMQEFAEKHPEQFQITYILSHAGDDWKGERGHVDTEILHKHGFEPDGKSVALLCGPPAMIQKAVLPALVDWGYDQDNDLFGF